MVRFLICFYIVVVLGTEASGQIESVSGSSISLPVDSCSSIMDTMIINHHPYIRFSNNRIENGGGNTLRHFINTFDSLAKFNDRQLLIYHFGGSHIQADAYPHRVRTHLQVFDTCMRGPRGWIFPFSAVATNNPSNYHVQHTGKWTAVRSPVKKDSSKILGLMGISASTKDSVSTIKIFNGASDSSFRLMRVRVYHNFQSGNYDLRVTGINDPIKVMLDPVAGFTEFDLPYPSDTLNLVVERCTTDTLPFTLYGIVLLNAEPGIIYNSIGVNGASFESYLRCQLFDQQLAQLPPDLAIISIGTNDANDSGFSPEKYAGNYEAFVHKIQKANPGCALIFTVPNDNYYKYRYPQKNVAKCRTVIYELAKKYDAGIWDFYDIMGGFGSSQKWYRDKLMKKDRIHFTKEGYDIKGDLFYEAFLKWYSQESCLRENKIMKN